MKERPIIFSGPMVRAILDGTKTQTRLLVKQSPIAAGVDWALWYDEKMDAQMSSTHFARLRCPYGVIGDRLWVRETFYCDHMLFGTVRSRRTDAPIDEMKRMLYYRADVPSGKFEDADYWGEPGSHWKSPIAMPRWASRITLEITDVRVQRLQDITEDDAKAEGMPPLVEADGSVTCGRAITFRMMDHV